MALPTYTDIVTMKYASDGGPFVQLSKPNDQASLKYASDGGPFWAQEISSAPPPAAGSGVQMYSIFF